MKFLPKFIIILSLNLGASSIYAQTIEEIRNISNFKGIHISSGMDLYVKQGSVESVKIVADKDKMDKIKTEKEGDILKIFAGSSKGWFNFEFDWSNRKTIKVYVTVKNLNSIAATGGSDVILSGTATVFKASSTGGSDLKASKLRSNFCSISSTGGSDAYVWAEKEISISATGGSDVYHKGGARVVKSSSTGGSDIHQQ